MLASYGLITTTYDSAFNEILAKRHSGLVQLAQGDFAEIAYTLALDFRTKVRLMALAHVISVITAGNMHAPQCSSRASNRPVSPCGLAYAAP